MSPRSIRRSQERKARKLARKQARLDAIETPETETGANTDEIAEQIPSTAAVVAAAGTALALEDAPEIVIAAEENESALVNTAVAAPKPQPGRATGPKTPEGKAKSCLKAVKTGLTGRTVLLPSDDVERYQQHVHDFFDEFQPEGPREHTLVQSLADTTWRLQRISTLEMGLFARGREEFAELFADRDPALQSSLIELHTLLTYEKQLRNLNIQEARLRRQRDKDIAELREVQNQRVTNQRTDLEIAAKMYIAAKKENKSFDAAEEGFEFSTDDVIAYLKGKRIAQSLHPEHDRNAKIGD
jgi:hypothetical protein